VKSKTKSKVRVCRCCGEHIYDFDAESGEWWCEHCDDWADL
jgi:transposase